MDKIHLIDKLIVGGGAVSNDLQNAIQNVSSAIYATYGMTETITHIAVKKLNHYNKRSVFYTCLSGVQIYIDNRSCLVIKAPKVSDDIIITNDVVQLVSENEFEWLGRFDNVINSGGVKLHPEIIEHKLSKVIDKRFFIIGIPDTRLGEKMVLFIEGDGDSKAEKKILAEIEQIETISKYEIPKKVFFIEEFIETETKKIQRNKTLDLISSKL